MNNLPPSDHVVWKLARLVILGTLFIVGANFAYANGWSKSDLVPLLTLLVGVGGFDQVKAMVASKSKEADE